MAEPPDVRLSHQAIKASPAAQLPRPEISSPGNTTVRFIPADQTARYLTKFAAPEEWFAISQPHFAQEELPGGSRHLLLDGLLIKAHNPARIFGKVRASLSQRQYFAFKVKTAGNIKKTVRERYPNYGFRSYYLFHFLGRRVLPKLKGLRKVSRLLGIPVDTSKAEIMGRLIYHGFDIVHIQENPDHTLFVAQLLDAVAPSAYASLPKGCCSRCSAWGKIISPSPCTNSGRCTPTPSTRNPICTEPMASTPGANSITTTG